MGQNVICSFLTYNDWSQIDSVHGLYNHWGIITFIIPSWAPCMCVSHNVHLLEVQHHHAGHNHPPPPYSWNVLFVLGNKDISFEQFGDARVYELDRDQNNWLESAQHIIKHANFKMHRGIFYTMQNVIPKCRRTVVQRQRWDVLCKVGCLPVYPCHSCKGYLSYSACSVVLQPGFGRISCSHICTDLR